MPLTKSRKKVKKFYCVASYFLKGFTLKSIAKYFSVLKQLKRKLLRQSEIPEERTEVTETSGSVKALGIVDVL